MYRMQLSNLIVSDSRGSISLLDKLIFDERILIRKLFLRIQVQLKIIPRLFYFILINLQTYSMFLKRLNTHSQ